MLCKAEDLPAGGKWSYEIKWDGQRGVATIEDGSVYLQSRSGKTDLTGRYPDVVEELSTLPNCVLDGELVVLGDELGLLPEGCEPDPVARFIVFDVLVEGDQETTARPLSERREILELLVPGGCYVARSPVFTDGEKLLDFVTEHGLEGLVAKDTASRYVEGGRGPSWVKVKVRCEQEFIVLGYTPGEGHREWAFGALILGYSEDGQIKYAGKVGTGFDDQELGKLKALMLPFEVGASPWDLDLPKDLAGSTWIAPSLVVQAAFQKWTEDGLLWHPSYLRVRDDKEPWEVGRDA
jgi:bifunctional non-homologous end joining protein LigD